MGVLLGLVKPLERVLDAILAFGRWFAIVAIAMMVLFILIQVFFRYVLNNALPWPDEAARFAMLWMTGLIAPAAYRRGGFVAIDMILLALPKLLGGIISLLLLGIAALVLGVAVEIGYGEITGFGGRFASAALYYPVFEGGSLGWERMPRAWMFASLWVGVILLLTVNIEMILRTLVVMMGGEDRLRPIPGETVVEAE